MKAKNGELTELNIGKVLGLDEDLNRDLPGFEHHIIHKRMEPRMAEEIKKPENRFITGSIGKVSKHKFVIGKNDTLSNSEFCYLLERQTKLQKGVEIE